MEQIRENIKTIQQEIEGACIRMGRRREEVTLLAVTKTINPTEMQIAYEEGLCHFAENKVQELVRKQPLFSEGITWHLIGHLQTNKVKAIVGKVSLIHSVDSLRLAEAIDNEAKKINVIQDILVQINVAEEETKFGLKTHEVEELVRQIALLKNVRIQGFMTIAPYVVSAEENRPIFRKMKQIFVDIKEKNIDNVSMNTLSMGMTHDYIVAVEEGATMLRIGTGIFGERIT